MILSTWEKTKKHYDILRKRGLVKDAEAHEYPDHTDIYIELFGGWVIQITEWQTNKGKLIEVLTDRYCGTFKTYSAANQFIYEHVKY